MQDKNQALTEETKVYLKRLSVIWTSPLSDCNRVIATNQFALPVRTYSMWSQHWSVEVLKNIDRQTRKIINGNGGKIAAVKSHENSDPMMRTVQQFEERSAEKGFSSFIKDANKFAEELGITLKFSN